MIVFSVQRTTTQTPAPRTIRPTTDDLPSRSALANADDADDEEGGIEEVVVVVVDSDGVWWVPVVLLPLAWTVTSTTEVEVLLLPVPIEEGRVGKAESARLPRGVMPPMLLSGVETVIAALPEPETVMEALPDPETVTFPDPRTVTVALPVGMGPEPVTVTDTVPLPTAAVRLCDAETAAVALDTGIGNGTVVLARTDRVVCEVTTAVTVVVERVVEMPLGPDPVPDPDPE